MRYERRRHYGTLLMALALAIGCTSLAVGETTLAGVSVGQEGKEVVRLYGEPADKTPHPEFGSTYWSFAPDNHGTRVMLEVMPGDIVLGISVAGGPNPAIKTATGVRLGDAASKVSEAYGRVAPEPVGEGAPEITLRYPASGLIFFLVDERVVQIDLHGDPEVVMPKVADWMVSDLQKRGEEEADARAATGLWLKQHGYYPTAIAEYQRALKLSPKSWEIMNNIGSAYLSMDDVPHAQEWFARGVAEKPDNATLHYNLGNVLHTLGRDDEARPYLTKAVELAGESERDVAAEALLVLGDILDDAGRGSGAIESYRQALKLAKDTQLLADIWHDMGIAYESKGETGEAIKAFQAALSYDPKLRDAQERLTRLQAGPSAPSASGR